MRRLLIALLGWLLLSAMVAADATAVTRSAEPLSIAPDVTLRVEGGGDIFLTARDLRTYGVETDGDRIVDLTLHQRGNVAGGLHLRVLYAGEFLGIPIHYGLGTFTDPDTGQRYAGPVLAVHEGVTDDVHSFAGVVLDRAGGEAVTFELLVRHPPFNCGSGEGLEPGTWARSFTTSAGVERDYLLTVPSTYAAGTPSDLLFSFHGLGMNMYQQNQQTGMEALTEQGAVLMVTPNGATSYGGLRGWLLGANQNADADFVYELIIELNEEFCLSGGYFATGFSMGGLMTSVLACRADSPFLAFAPVAAVLHNSGCADAGPRTITGFHGTADTSVPIGPVPATMQRWADHNGCTSGPIDEAVDSTAVHHVWSGCDAATSWYEIIDLPHVWPGSAGGDFSASEIIWDLFFG